MEANHLRHILLSNPLWKRLADYKEVPIVAELIMSDETIYDVAFGLYEEHLGLVVVTETRVLFGGRKPASLFKHTKTEVFEFSRITSVQVNGSALLSTLIIVTSGAKGEIKSMATPDCRRVGDLIRQRLSPKPVAAPPAATSSPSFDLGSQPVRPTKTTELSDQLAKLADLHEKGLLSEAEFATAKARLLGL